MTDSSALDAHRWLCRTLSPYFAEEPIVAPNEKLWPEIVRLSDSWLVSARLQHRLRGCDFVPSDACDVLTAISNYTRDRADMMRSELAAIIATLNAVDVRPVVIKGAEWLLGHYALSSHRIMTDIDIWTPSDSDQVVGLEALQAYGFVPVSPLSQHDKAVSHHYPPLHRDGAIARLELHHDLIRSTLTGMMALDGAEDRLVAVEQSGLSYFRLSPMDGVTVAYLQSGHMASPGFKTRRVTIAKWLDFLDRVHKVGPVSIKSASDIGLLVDDNGIDRQLLTVLQDFFGMPYAGERDTGYIDTWTKPVTPVNLLLAQLYRSVSWQNLSSAKKWRSFSRNFRRKTKINQFHSKL